MHNMHDTHSTHRAHCSIRVSSITGYPSGVSSVSFQLTFTDTEGAQHVNHCTLDHAQALYMFENILLSVMGVAQPAYTQLIARIAMREPVQEGDTFTDSPN
jgi:hypothetical protein